MQWAASGPLTEALARVLHGDRGDEPKSRLRMVDAVTVPVPDWTRAWRSIGTASVTTCWRNDEVGQAGLRLPDSETEIVLSRNLPPAPNWLVTSVPDAVGEIVAAGGSSWWSLNRSLSVAQRSSPIHSATHSACSISLMAATPSMTAVVSQASRRSTQTIADSRPSNENVYQNVGWAASRPERGKRS